MSYIDLTQDTPPLPRKSKKASKERRQAMPLTNLSSPEPELQKVKIERRGSAEASISLNFIDALVTIPDGLEASAIENAGIDIGQTLEADDTIQDDGSEDGVEMNDADEDDELSDVHDEDIEGESEVEVLRASEPFIIDPEGDLVIVAGQKSSGVERFLVNSAWLRSIKPWNNYLEAHPPTLATAPPSNHNDHARPHATIVETSRDGRNTHDTSAVGILEEEHCSHEYSGEHECSTEDDTNELVLPTEIEYPILDDIDSATYQPTGLVIELPPLKTNETPRPSPNPSRGDLDTGLQADIEAQSDEAEKKNTRQSLSGWYTAELLKLDGDGANLEFDRVVDPLSLDTSINSPDISQSQSAAAPKYVESVETACESGTPTHLIQGAPAEHLATLNGIEEDESVEISVASSTPTPQPAEHITVEESAVPRYPETILHKSEPEAVGIMLSIIHLRMDLLPPTVDFDTIYNLAILCEQFDMEILLQERVVSWIHRLLPDALEIGSMHWMYIAWVFKLPELFEAHLQHLACTSIADEGQLEILSIDGKSGNHLVDLVSMTRQQLLQDIVDVVAKYVDEIYWNRHFKCKFDLTVTDCREHAYIAFAVKMRIQGLWPSLPAVSSIRKSPVEVREDIHNFEIAPYSAEHADCLDLIHQFKNEILSVPYKKQSDEMHSHFQTSLDIGETKLFSLIGSHLYDYGFAPQDFGHTSFVASRKRRRYLDLSNKRGNDISGRLLLEDELSDDPDSDFSLPSDSEDEVEESFTRDDATAALADLEGRQPPAKKRARYGQTNKARHQEDLENLYEYGLDE